MLSVFKYFRKVIIAFLYLLGFLILGETHPFSQYPMYNSFPNWSYVFYFTNTQNELIPCNNFGISGGELAHMFYANMNDKGYHYGYEQEDPKELEEIGEIIVSQLDLKNTSLSRGSADTIFLTKICYKFESDSIVKTKQKFYGFTLE